MPNPIHEAEVRMQHLLGLAPHDASRAVAEALDCFAVGVDEYIGVRHAELRGQGMTNEAIYERLAEELPRLRFKAPALSARQIRRRIYG